MLKEKENLEQSKVKLLIEVPAPEVDTALTKAYHKVVKKVRLDGFRKGKVPRRILETRFGPEILHEEALEYLVPPAYDEAVKEAEIEPVNHPEFELVSLKEGEPLLFNAVVEVIPPVEIGNYDGLAAEQVEAAVDPLQVDHHLYMLRQQNARLVPKEEGQAEEGDLLTIDFEGFIEDEPFEGGAAENYSLELGSKSFIPGFEEQLVGAAPESEVEVQVTFPEQYGKEELAGKEALFKVAVKQIKQKVLPDLDDEFVKEVSEFETLEEMKADLEAKLLSNAEEQSKNKLEDDLIQEVTKTSTVDVPNILVERQMDRMIGDLEQYLRYQGIGLDQFVAMAGKTQEELREEKRDEALTRAKANLVLDAIAKKEGIAVEDSEIDARIAEMAGDDEIEQDRIKKILENQGRLPAMKEEMRIRKAIDLLVEKAQITMVKPEEKKQDEEEAATAGAENEAPEDAPAESEETGE